jgi:hypothetical protein
MQGVANAGVVNHSTTGDIVAFAPIVDYGGSYSFKGQTGWVLTCPGPLCLKHPPPGGGVFSINGRGGPGPRQTGSWAILVRPLSPSGAARPLRGPNRIHGVVLGDQAASGEACLTGAAPG